MAGRAVVEIDESKCDGCGQCVPKCAEGALAVVGGKVRLVDDIFCDGLGSCIGHCPRGALRVTTREARPFDEAAVQRRQQQGMPESARTRRTPTEIGIGGCPGAAAMVMPSIKEADAPGAAQGARASMLRNWPVQWRLIPVDAMYLRRAPWLVAADCAAYACADFHSRVLAGRMAMVGCPKLDDIEAFTAKMTAMIKENLPESITVARMEVPCCGALERVVADAVEHAGVKVPVKTVLIGIGGETVEG